MKWMHLAESRSDPTAKRAPKHAQDGRDDQWRDGGNEEEQPAKLTVEKAGLFGVAVNNVNPFHDELHDLRAGEQGAGPADDRQFPGLRATLDEEFGDNLAASWRKVLGKISDEVEQVGLAAPTAGGHRNGKKQGREEGQKEVI